VPAAEIEIHSNQTAKISTPWGFPLREDVAFTNAAGADAGRLARRARKALERLQQPLGKILEPGEVVLYFSSGQIMPDSPERFMLGVAYRVLTRAGLVVTNRRLLYLTLKKNGEWNRGLRSVYWGDVKEFRISGSLRGKLELKYLEGPGETYYHLPKAAAEKLRLILEALLPLSQGESSPARRVVSLCPQCLAHLAPGIYQCANCQMKFKDENGAVMHGLFIPGGAYFYAELDLLGIAHAFLDVSILFSAIAWVMAAMGKIRPPRMQGAPPIHWIYGVAAGILFTFLLADVWVSIRVARKHVRKFIPES
jgi:hypothetical protein